jgi:hypothetical protein
MYFTLSLSGHSPMQIETRTFKNLSPLLPISHPRTRTNVEIAKKFIIIDNERNA